MINKELSLYIDAQIAIGTPQNIIKEMLVTRGGWRESDVDEALRSILNPIPAQPAPVAPQPVSQPKPAPQPVQPSRIEVDAVRPQPSQARMPGTTLISQSPELQTARPVVAAAPVGAQAPVASPTPTPVAPAIPPTQTPTPAPAAAAPASWLTRTATPAQPAVPVQPQPNMAAPYSFATPPAQPSQPSPVSSFVPPSAAVTGSSPIPPTAAAPLSSSTPVAPTAPVPVQVSTPMTPIMQQPVSPLADISDSVLPSAMAINDIKPPVQSVYDPTRAGQPAMFSGMQGSEPVIRETTPGRGKKIAIIVSTIIILLLAAAAAYGYFFYLNPSPKVAFANVLPQLTSAKTGHFKGTMVAEFDKGMASLFLPQIGQNQGTTGVPISENNTGQATISFDGMFDRTDAANEKTDISLAFSSNVIPVSISLQTKFIDNTLYAKVPDLGFLNDLTGGNTGGFLPGDWVQFSKADLSEPLPGTTIMPSFISNLTAEKKDQIRNIIFNAGVITPTIELSKEKLNGVSVHRYQFSVNQQALAKAIADSSVIASGQAMSPDDNAVLNDILSSFTVADGQLWVGVWDRKPYRIMFTLKPTEGGSDAISSIKFDSSLDAFGSPASITAPVSAKPFSSLFQDAQNKGRDAAIKAGLTSAVPAAEIYYGSKRTYLGLCADTTVKSIIDTMAAKYAPSVYCKDSARTYAVAFPLASESGVACMDNGGKIISLATLPTGTSCK